MESKESKEAWEVEKGIHTTYVEAEYRQVERFIADVFGHKEGKKKVTNLLVGDIKCLSAMYNNQTDHGLGRYKDKNNMEVDNKRGRLSCKYKNGRVTKYEDSTSGNEFCCFNLKMDESKSKGSFVLHGRFERLLNSKLRLECNFEDGDQKGELKLYDVDSQSKEPFLIVDEAINFDLKKTDIKIDLSLAPNLSEKLRCVKSKKFAVHNNSVLLDGGFTHTVACIFKSSKQRIGFTVSYESASGRNEGSEDNEIRQFVENLNLGSKNEGRIYNGPPKESPVND